MHHLYPSVKGDPLCPLGFHPQVRWPTRCKRCFRDYKEHGGKRREPDTALRKDSSTASTPNIGNSGSIQSQNRHWTSNVNLADNSEIKNRGVSLENSYSNPSSWISTPDLAHLEDGTQASVPTVSLTLPFKRKKPVLDTGQLLLPTASEVPKKSTSPINTSNDAYMRIRKAHSTEEKPKRIQIKELKLNEEPTNNDVQFLIQVKSKAPTKEKQRSDSIDLDDDSISNAGTETTDTTLVDHEDFGMRRELSSLKKELDASKTKCDRLEKEKSNILLRRLTAMDSTKSTSSEVLKLQQRCNELQTQMEDYRDEKKSLALRVKELEDDLENRPAPQATQKVVDELRSKLLAAEMLCEELMDENEDMKKEMHDLEDEMEEMQDNFREDQADEYSSLKKELEQTTKNCRILSFKLRKTERKLEQVETEKTTAETKLKDMSGVQSSLHYGDKIKQLEKDLATSVELSKSLQKKLDETTSTTSAKKAPLLGSLDKNHHNKVSRESLTRGGSQDDPTQIARDLQDSLEREADLREQLKFAEEEAQTLRKKATRIEEDNESLLMQLKKMAMRTNRGRKLSPTSGGLNSIEEKGATNKSDGANVGELKLQLELSEQESAVLRKKLEDLEQDNDNIKKKNKELMNRTTKSTLRQRNSDDADLAAKLKTIQTDLKEAQTKLVEKERDCKRFESELSLNRRRSLDTNSIKSIELEQRSLNSKQQLELIEKETEVLRNKVQNLESENEKLMTENKRLQLLRGTKNMRTDKTTTNKMIDQIAVLEVELSEANTKIISLEGKLIDSPKDVKASTIDNELLTSLKSIKTRRPKYPTELSTKLQLKNMVLDLEKEFSDLMMKVQKVESGKRVDVELKSNGDSTVNAEIANKLASLEQEYEKSKNTYEDLNKQYLSVESERNKTINEIEELKVSNKKYTDEYKQAQEEISKLRNISKELDEHKIEIGLKEKEIKKLTKDLKDKEKSYNEISSTAGSLSALQREVKEKEQRVKDIETQLKQSEQQLQDERFKIKSRDREITTLKGSCDEFGDKISELNASLKKQIQETNSKTSAIKSLEDNLETEKKKLKQGASAENATLQRELSELKTKLNEAQTDLRSTDRNKKTLQESVKKLETDAEKEKEKLEKLISEKDLDLQIEKKKTQTLKTNYEKDIKTKETELNGLKTKMKTMDTGGSLYQKVSEVKTEYEDKIKKMEQTLKSEKTEYENLTAKYEVLEEEHVVTKAQLVMEKETLNSQLLGTKKAVAKLEEQIEQYIKADKSAKKQITDLKDLVDKRENASESNNMEKSNLKSILEERQQEVDQIKREYAVIHDQLEYMRRENDELKKKLDDFDKVSKIQRNISADSSAMDYEMKQLRTKVASLEKGKKSDVAECKIRYESQVSVLNEELRSLHNQVTRFKREKDTYKHMLEGAQKTIGDLKSGKITGRENRNSIPKYDELEESKSKVATLEQQISCMEDELSESRLEGSKLKTELISERSSLEIRTSELQSRINELEEEKILSSGRTKIVGLRTRMELSWQKEREEQQRLLQETATLARDLRQTLFEVERERDKERLEGRRKTDQMKKTLDEEQEESRRKTTELQCDLLELRDAHAKLRTTNEKLRREKERQERERDELKTAANGKRRNGQGDERRVAVLLQYVDSLTQLAPELFPASQRGDSVGPGPAPYTPTPPKRTKSKSRESSPGLGLGGSRESLLIRDDRRAQVQTTCQKLLDVADELRRSQMEDGAGMGRRLQRATSTENDGGVTMRYNSSGYQRPHALHRKSLSLEQSKFLQDNIPWADGSIGGGSDVSLDMQSDIETRTVSSSRARRDASLDSRLSGGSTQSDVAEKKKKKSIMGKLKKLTKSRSIDDQDPGTFQPIRQLSSKNNSASSDINEDPKGSKKDLKNRITDMFKRTGGSRSNSVERQLKHDTHTSTQRPLMRNNSNSNLQQ